MLTISFIRELTDGFLKGAKITTVISLPRYAAERELNLLREAKETGRVFKDIGSPYRILKYQILPSNASF